MSQPDYIGDQADGLRRLLARSSAQVVTVVGARSGLGATSVVLNLAASWAKAGKEVLVLDEHVSPDNVANSLALKPRYDLLNVVHGDKSLREVILRSDNGVFILPVARAMQALPKLDENQRARLSQLLLLAANGMDILLVDAAAREGHSVSTSLSSKAPLLLVLNATASGVTESYAMLKQMALENGQQAFDIVVNKVSDEREARMVFDNIQKVAGRYLCAQLNYVGYIPVDEKLHRATQLRQAVVNAFPFAPATQAIGLLAQQLAHTSEFERRGSPDWAEVMQRLTQRTRITRKVSAIL